MVWNQLIMAADCATASTALQQATRESYAITLAELAAAARSSNPCLAAALEAEKKPAKRQQLEKIASSMFKAALTTPFVEAAVAGNKVCLSARAVNGCMMHGVPCLHHYHCLCLQPAQA
jgi:hypothetical protein